jgi:hypothetical protein
MKYGIPEGSSIDLPVSQVDPESKSREIQMANFTEKPEWKLLKEHLEARKKFYQLCLPNGTPITEIPMEEVAARWVAANTIIQEIDAIISTYEEVAKSVRTQTT